MFGATLSFRHSLLSLYLWSKCQMTDVRRFSLCRENYDKCHQNYNDFFSLFFFFNNIHELGLGCVRIIYPMSYRLDIARWLDLVYIYSFFTIYYAVIRLRHVCFTQKNIVV